MQICELRRFLMSNDVKRQKLNGFTLIELMVTITIAAILLAIAVPSFQSLMLSSRLTSLGNSFLASAQAARTEAIKRNTTVTLCATNNDSGTCAGTWADGWVIGYTDSSVSPAVWRVISRAPAFASGFLLQGGDITSIVFQSTGFTNTPASLTLCRSTPSVGDEKRAIDVEGTGRVRIVRVRGATTCP